MASSTIQSAAAEEWAIQLRIPSRWREAFEQGDVVVAVSAYRDWLPWLDQASGMLSTEESLRVGAKRFPVHKAQLILSYALHRIVLAQLLGCAPRAVRLERDARGRPEVPGRDVATSLSHSDELFAIAATRGGEVGVDVEHARRAHGLGELAGQICSASEAARLRPLDAQDRDAELLRHWVRKEAFLKATGLGLSGEMPLQQLPEQDDQPVCSPLLAGVSSRLLDVSPENVLAVAAPVGTRVEWGWLAAPGT